jgi:HlyD family secretion protein
MDISDSPTDRAQHRLFCRKRVGIPQTHLEKNRNQETSMKTIRIFLMTILVITLSACSVFQPDNSQTARSASGVVAATDISVAAEIGGKVIQVDTAEGDSVNAGDMLFKLDCSLLQAQREQSQAAADLANAAVMAASAQQENAQAQYNLTRQAVDLQETPKRTGAWTAPSDNAIDLPNWYFQPDETVAATQAELDAAQKALDIENANLQNELEKASNADFVAVEKHLAQAQVAYQVANLTDEQAQSATENSDLKKASQDTLDTANNGLKAAQSAYTGMLTSTAAQSVLEARARVAAAQARLDNAQDRLTSLQTGDQSLQLQAVAAGMKQALAAVTQAQSSLAQANAALKLIDLQIEKCTVKAPQAGVISSRNLESGEMVAPGGTVMVISQLNPVTLTVYIPEDRYGQIKLGQQVSIFVDSFPDDTITGTVQFISSEAEFTPRDVQTVSGRKATVYAVKIKVPNEQGLLKPGMAADVTFIK